MKVLFDFSLGADDRGGPATLMRGLVRGWREEFPSDQLTVFGQQSLVDGLDIEAVEPRSKIRPKRMTQQQIELPFRERKIASAADVVIVPNIGCSIAPLGSPIVGTLNDLRHLARPADFSRQARIYRGLTWPLFTSRMSAVAAISQFSLEEARRLGFKLPQHTGVARLGADHVPAQAASAITSPTIVCVAHRASKNPIELAAVGRDLQRAGLDDIVIRITGMQSGKARVAVLQEFHRMKVRRPPEFIGYLDERDLYDLVATSRALVYLSRYEGFGLVPTEATRLGTRTFAYDLAPYRERMSELNATLAPVGGIGDLSESLVEFLSSADRPTVFPTQTSWRETAQTFRSLAAEVAG